MPSAVGLTVSGALVAPGATRSPASSSRSPFSLSSTVYLTSSPRSALDYSSFKKTMGSDMVHLQHVSCLGNLNHTGRAVPPFLTWTLFRCRSAQEIVRYPHLKSVTIWYLKLKLLGVILYTKSTLARTLFVVLTSKTLCPPAPLSSSRRSPHLVLFWELEQAHAIQCLCSITGHQ